LDKGLIQTERKVLFDEKQGKYMLRSGYDAPFLIDVDLGSVTSLICKNYVYPDFSI
jgi:hypothetical protein